MKRVPFKMPKATKAADQWVGRGGDQPRQKPANGGPMKRFTLDVPERLHREIKATCARKGTKMADVIREILEREFPLKS